MPTIESQNIERGGVRRWLLPIAIAICSAGAGVTGTLLWIQERQPAANSTSVIASTPAQTAPMTSAMPADVPAAKAPLLHEPPPALTAGLTPAEKALTLGNWYYDHEQWARAIGYYQQVIAGGMNNANIRTDLGNCFRFNQQPELALEQYRIAQKLEPRHEQSFFNQGGLYRFALHNPQKAITIWREYVKRFPQGQSVADAKRLIRETQAQMKSGAKATTS